MRCAPGKSAAIAPRFRNRPGQRCRHRRLRRVDVMPVEAHAGFQPQRVSRAQPDRLYARIGQQPLRKRLGFLRRKQNFEAVFARIARARHHARLPVHIDMAHLHERHVRRRRCDAGHHRACFRPLQRQQCIIVGARELRAVARMRGNARKVLLLGPGIDDDIEHALPMLLGRARHHQVVEDAAVLVEQQGELLFARRQAAHIGADQRLENVRNLLVRIRPAQLRQGQEARTHVADVEQTGVAARPVVLGHDPFGILHRHVVAAELDHASAQLHMQRMERRLLERTIRAFRHFGLRQVRAIAFATTPPLSDRPERFTRPFRTCLLRRRRDILSRAFQRCRHSRGPFA